MNKFLPVFFIFKYFWQHVALLTDLPIPCNKAQALKTLKLLPSRWDIPATEVNAYYDVTNNKMGKLSQIVIRFQTQLKILVHLSCSFFDPEGII